MAEIHPIAEREMKFVRERGILSDGELVVEVEAAMRGWQTGALIVTDRRVLWSASQRIRRRTATNSLWFPTIEHLAVERSHVSKARATLAITARREDASAQRFAFAQIPGGEPRARQLADSIRREQDRFLERGTHEHPSLPAP